MCVRLTTSPCGTQFGWFRYKIRLLLHDNHDAKLSRSDKGITRVRPTFSERWGNGWKPERKRTRAIRAAAATRAVRRPRPSVRLSRSELKTEERRGQRTEGGSAFGGFRYKLGNRWKLAPLSRKAVMQCWAAAAGKNKVNEVRET